LSAELKFIEKCADKFKVIYYSDEEKTPWEVEIYIRDAIYKIEVYFHNYPLSPPMLKMKDFTLYPKGIIDSKLIINLPVLNPGTWSISNKLVEVLDTIWHFFLSSY
jgi:ubiquitin-protein ligase